MAAQQKKPPPVTPEAEQRVGNRVERDKEIADLTAALGPVIVQAQVRGAFVCLGAMFLCQVNYELWSDYAGMALWAFILSEALKSGRESFVLGMKELIEHLEDSREISAHMYAATLLAAACCIAQASLTRLTPPLHGAPRVVSVAWCTGCCNRWGSTC
jgi:hypothetical protein